MATHGKNSESARVRNIAPLKPPEFTSDDLVVLQKFALFELTIQELRQKVHDKLGSHFRDNKKMPWFGLNSFCPEPTVRITPQHVENLLAKRRRREISERQMRDWATMIQINDAYFWEPADDVVAEWVCRLSMDLIPED